MSNTGGRLIAKDCDGNIIHILNPGDYGYEERKEWIHQQQLKRIETIKRLTKRDKFKRI